MFSLLVLAVLFCAFVLILHKRLKESRAHLLPPAFPGSLPIIGINHLLCTDTARLWDLVKKLSMNSVNEGGVTYCQIGADIYYLVTDPEDGLTVANSCMQKHFAYNFANCWLGEGLVTGSGERWHRHRKLMNPAFSIPIIHGFLRVFNNEPKLIYRKIDGYAGKGPFDPSPYIKEIILRISCKTVFGINSIRDERIFWNYMVAVDELLHVITQRFQKLWLQNDLIYKLSGRKKKEDELVKSLNRIPDEMILKVKAAMKNESNDIKSFDQELNDTDFKPLVNTLIMLGDSLTDEEIREELNTIIAAAFETTSHTLECILVLLGSFPEVQERIFQEFVQVLGPDNDVEKEDLQKLVYTEAVIKESLRLIPIAPVLLRHVEHDVKLNNYTMRAGSQCLILAYGLHRATAWGADADQFRPERWLDGALPSNPCSFAGFSFGKRGCLGKTYALTSLKVMLAHLVRRYKIQADYTSLKFVLNVTLKPDKGHEIKIQRRNYI